MGRALRPDLAAVKNHSKCLRTLYLDVVSDGSTPDIYPWNELYYHLGPCCQLEQLALPFPDVDLCSGLGIDDEWGMCIVGSQLGDKLDHV
jgi:hypothetical protein